MEPTFLSVQDVLDLHARTIARHGGSHGIRNLGLLESAVALPRQSFDGRYVHDDLAAMAEAYLFHIASNHSFVDGNKRAGLAACLTACLAFFLANGAKLPWSLAASTCRRSWRGSANGCCRSSRISRLTYTTRAS
jgi:death-on-curing protein